MLIFWTVSLAVALASELPLLVLIWVLVRQVYGLSAETLHVKHSIG